MANKSQCKKGTFSSCSKCFPSWTLFVVVWKFSHGLARHTNCGGVQRYTNKERLCVFMCSLLRFWKQHLPQNMKLFSRLALKEALLLGTMTRSFSRKVTYDTHLFENITLLRKKGHFSRRTCIQQKDPFEEKGPKIWKKTSLWSKNNNFEEILFGKGLFPETKQLHSFSFNFP